ncbi:transglycosylase SLT domain-containing protein [Elusimicrobiota bacterium]
MRPIRTIAKTAVFMAHIICLGALSAGAWETPAYQQEEEAVERNRAYEKLSKAQMFYVEGIENLQIGRYSVARRRIKKAFKLVSEVLLEEGLPESAKTEFENLIEKIREAMAEEEYPGIAQGLEVPEGELEEVSPLSSVPRDGHTYTITIDTNNSITQKYLALYTRGEKRKKLVLKAFEKSGQYNDMILSQLKANGLPRELFYLVMVESEYNPKAYSRAGAAGLWQFMRFTGRKYGLRVNYWVDERFDPEKATGAAMKYLKELHEWFGDWHLALAAYNRGEHGIGRDMKRTKSTDFSQLSQRGVLPRETGNFVPKFMACVLLGDNPQDYGFYPVYEEPVKYDTVTLDKPLSLKIAAKCAGTKVETLRKLNPSIQLWCTPKNYPNFVFRLPAGTKQTFLEELAKVKNWNPAPELIRYRIRRGDVLSKIAVRYRTSVRSIMQTNGIRNARKIRVGQVLKISPGKKYSRGKKRSKTKKKIDWSAIESGKHIKYKIKPGDVLSEIALKYKTSVRTIKRDNNISNSRKIRAGQVILIRPGKK